MGDFDELAGPWTLVDAAGVAGEPTVRFWVNPLPGPNWVEVELDTGWCLEGPWRAGRAGQFLAGIASAGSGCPRQLWRRGSALRAWLEDATGFIRTGAELVLHDRHQQPTARLTRSARQACDPCARGYRRRVPEVPAGLVPAGPDQLLGAWRPVHASVAGQPPWQNVEFCDDGWWRGFPRGSVNALRYVAGPDGTLLSVLHHAVALGYSPVLGVETWLCDAARAGLDGDVLVVFDDEGEERQRLRRTPGPHAGRR